MTLSNNLTLLIFCTYYDHFFSLTVPPPSLSSCCHNLCTFFLMQTQHSMSRAFLLGLGGLTKGMWIFDFHTLAAAAQKFTLFCKFPGMRFGYSNLALVVVALLSISRAQCPDYTSYSQVNFLYCYISSMIEGLARLLMHRSRLDRWRYLTCGLRPLVVHSRVLLLR